MNKRILLFAALLLALLPLGAMADTWSFEWNKSHSDATAQGFYNFGTSYVEKDVYTTELNGLQWSIASEGTKTYAYTANGGQNIGKVSEPASHCELWTSGFEGKITAVRITARKQKDEYEANLSVSVGETKLASGTMESVSLSSTLTEMSFTPTGEAEEGKLTIVFDQTSDTKGVLYIKKIEVDYEPIEAHWEAPQFSPEPGTYDETQQVNILSKIEGDGQEIYYTTDGSNPRTASTARKRYNGPIEVSQTTTIKAIVYASEQPSAIATGTYVIRQDPGFYFYKDSIALITGNDGYADLVNPNKVDPITFSSSASDICSVDEYGTLYSSYVTKDTTVTITATFAGNDLYRPQTTSMKVTVLHKDPLKTPVVTPLGGTFTEPVEVTISTDDPNAVTIWYSTTATSAEEFADDYTLSTIKEANTVTFTINKTCRLYVMTRGYNVNSDVVTADFVINEPLSANFTTDHAKKAYYTQDFNSAEEMADWTMGDGWNLADKSFNKIKSDDTSSVFISYVGNGTTTLTSPEFTIKDKSEVEFYANFSGIYLVWGSWQLNAIDTESNESTQLFDAFTWAQENAYTGPAWNKFNIDISSLAGKKVKFEFNYTYGGEDLALDAFSLNEEDPTAATVIHIFEGESVNFVSTSTGNPETYSWTFEGGTPETADTDEVEVCYNTAGTYNVSLTVSSNDESDTMERQGFVVVSQHAPTALIGLPEEGYESPFVGVFVPTGVPVTFRDLSEGKPTEWNWVFQHTDKTTSNEQNPTVTFVDKGTFSVGLTAKNDAGESSDMLAYAIQAGGAQYVWNISPEENSTLDAIAMGWYGYYAGTNWLGMERFAEHYKAPLADAEVDSVAVYFASTTTVSPDADITLTMHAVDADGNPGQTLATTSLKASELKYDADSVVATVFHFDAPVELKAGTDFFIAIGPFPNNSMDESPYTSDDIAILCCRRGTNEKCTAWQLLEDQDESGNSLGTYTWYKNTDDPVSMAIAPVVTYLSTATGIGSVQSTTTFDNAPTAIYNLSGQRIQRPQEGSVYIVRQADGTSRKMVWKNR